MSREDARGRAHTKSVQSKGWHGIGPIKGMARNWTNQAEMARIWTSQAEMARNWTNQAEMALVSRKSSEKQQLELSWATVVDEWILEKKYEFSREGSDKEDRLLRTAVVNKDGWLKKDEFSRESSEKEDRLLRTAAVNKYGSEIVSKCWRFFLDISSLELQVFWRCLSRNVCNSDKLEMVRIVSMNTRFEEKNW